MGGGGGGCGDGDGAGLGVDSLESGDGDRMAGVEDRGCHPDPDCGWVREIWPGSRPAGVRLQVDRGRIGPGPEGQDDGVTVDRVE